MQGNHSLSANGAEVLFRLSCKLCKRIGTSELASLRRRISNQPSINSYHSFPEMEDDHMIDHIYGVPSPTTKLPMPEEKELRAMFEVPLDRSIRDTHFPVKIPMRKKADEDVKME